MVLQRHDGQAQVIVLDRGPGIPPDQIEAACLRIQATWDDRTRELRAVYKTQGVTLRRIPLHGVEEPTPEEDP